VLDGIRGLAILLVLVCHGSLIREGAPGFDRSFILALRTGWIGVDLFFVLSGFLITGILLKDKGRSDYFKRFYVRRMLRIVPVYYGFLFVVLVLLPLIRPMRSTAMRDAMHDQIWLWTYSMNLARFFGSAPHLDVFGQFWSLAIEEHFYLIWPFVVLWLSRRQLLGFIAVCGCGTVLLRWYLWYRFHDPNMTYDFTLCRLDSLLAGCFIALAMTSPERRLRLRKFSKTAAITSAALLGALFFRYSSWWADAPVILFGYSLLAIAFGSGLILAITGASGPVAKILASWFLRLLGKHSYAIYVIHFTFEPFVWRFTYFKGLERLGSIAPAVIVSITLEVFIWLIASIAIWHLWERHFLKLRDKWTPSNSPVLVANLSVASTVPAAGARVKAARRIFPLKQFLALSANRSRTGE